MGNEKGRKYGIQQISDLLTIPYTIMRRRFLYR